MSFGKLSHRICCDSNIKIKKRKCRKGIQSLVLERSDSLRAAGAAIGVFINGWRAVDQLGVGTAAQPFEKAIPILEHVLENSR